MTIAPDTVLFASDDSDDALTDAKEYIKIQEFTHDDVKLVKRDSQILVVAIKGIK